MKSKATTPSTRWLVMAGLATLLSACGPDHSDLYTYIDSVKSRPGGTIPALPQPKPAPSYEYEPGDRRSPFTADAPAQANSIDPDAVDAPDQDRPKETLEGEPLDSLTMVGTISNSRGYYGLVRDSDGLVYDVTVGNHMGFDYGRIVDISESEIRLIEIVSDGLGGWREREASISIGDE